MSADEGKVSEEGQKSSKILSFISCEKLDQNEADHLRSEKSNPHICSCVEDKTKLDSSLISDQTCSANVRERGRVMTRDFVLALIKQTYSREVQNIRNYLWARNIALDEKETFDTVLRFIAGFSFPLPHEQIMYVTIELLRILLNSANSARGSDFRFYADLIILLLTPVSYFEYADPSYTYAMLSISEQIRAEMMDPRTPLDVGCLIEFLNDIYDVVAEKLEEQGKLSPFSDSPDPQR